MPGADGSVWIKTEIDNKEAQKQLDKLERDIKKTQSSINETEAKKAPYVEDMEEYKLKNSDKHFKFCLKGV